MRISRIPRLVQAFLGPVDGGSGSAHVDHIGSATVVIWDDFVDGFLNPRPFAQRLLIFGVFSGGGQGNSSGEDPRTPRPWTFKG